MNTQEPVTVVLRRRVKPGAEAAFEQAMRQFIQFALSFPGNRGIDVLRPQPGGTREYTLIDHFADLATRRAFKEPGPWRPRRIARGAALLPVGARVRGSASAPTWYEPGMEATTNSQPTSDRTFYVFNGVVSVSALAFLFYILVVRRGTAGTGLDLRFMPAVNASLNALSACLLTTGWVAIRRKAVQLHRYCQVSAFASSSLFLIGYLAYHFIHGDTKFQGRGPIRAMYLVILASHIVLSMGIVPMALTSFYFAWKRAFVKHRAIARVTLPIWLYVSVTGVVIFFMLRGSVPAVP